MTFEVETEEAAGWGGFILLILFFLLLVFDILWSQYKTKAIEQRLRELEDKTLELDVGLNKMIEFYIK